MGETYDAKFQREVSQFLSLCHAEGLIDPRSPHRSTAHEDIRPLVERLALAFDTTQAAAAIRANPAGAATIATLLAESFDLSKISPTPPSVESPDETRAPFALICELFLDRDPDDF